MAFNTYPCNPWPISTEQLNKGNNDNLNTRVAALEGEVSDLSDTKANQITIAPFFDPEASYEVGDMVYYNGLTYRCTNDHEGDWDADDFAATTIAGELDTLKSGLNNVIALVAFSYATKTIDLPSGGIDTVQFTLSDFTLPSGYSANLACVIVSAIGNWGIEPEKVGLAFPGGNADMSGGLNVNIKGGASGGTVTYRVNVLLGIYKS